MSDIYVRHICGPGFVSTGWVACMRPLYGNFPFAEKFSFVIPAKAGIQSRRGYRIAARPRKTIKRKDKYKNKVPGFRAIPPFSVGIDCRNDDQKPRSSVAGAVEKAFVKGATPLPPLSGGKKKQKSLNRRRASPFFTPLTRGVGGFFNSPESGGAAVDFTGFRFDPRLFLREDETNNRQSFQIFLSE